MKNLFLLVLMALSLSTNAQQFSSANPAYIDNVKAGERNLLSENYDSCIVYYKMAFKIKQTSVLSTLRAAACAYSLDDKTYLEEQLSKAFELDWGSAKGIYNSYSEFEYLRETPFDKMIATRWEKAANDAGVNMELMKELEKIGEEDQRYRREMRPIREKYGWESPQMDSLWVLQNYADSVNTARVIEIIAEHGYPGRSLVAGEASTAFLVIQHADLEVQEEYLPIMIEAAEQEELRWSSVALLIDRVNVRNERPQIYGTQLGQDKETGEYYFSEIAEPFKIDSIRSSVGLPPLQSYADNWNHTWDPESHVKKVVERKAKKEKEEKE